MSQVSRRSFLKRVGASALAGGAIGSIVPRLLSDSSPRPNILIICVDQMRFREIAKMPDNPTRPTIASLIPNITKLQSTGSAAITDPTDPAYNPGSGVSFTNYMGAATACTPARAAWITGLYAPQTRMYETELTGTSPTLNTGFPTWGSILTDSAGGYGFSTLGYNTAWFGKWHLSDAYGSPAGLKPYGYSYVWPGVSPNGNANEGASGGQAGYGSSSEDMVSDAQISLSFQDWLDVYGSRQPWCSTVSFVNPHDVTAAPISFGPILDPANAQLDIETALSEFGISFPVSTSFPAGGFTGSVFDGYFSQGPLAGGVANWEDVEALSNAGVKPSLQGATMQGRQSIQGLVNPDGTRQPFSNEGFVRILDVYLWLWSMVDQQIGAVLDALWSKSREAAGTMIVFTADHGEFGGAHGMMDKTGAMYDEAIHVPLSIWFPYALQDTDVPMAYQGTRNNPCSAVDFCPLILTLASGGEAWRDNTSLAHLQNRQSICAMLMGQAGTNARPYTITTTDELRVDEGTPVTVGGQHHIIAYRDAGGKYVQSSYWMNCTDAIDPTQPQFVEFYDYVMGNKAEMGNDYPTSPNVPAYAQAFAAAVTKEFILPPEGLSAPYGQALTDYLNYASQMTGGGCST